MSIDFEGVAHRLAHALNTEADTARDSGVAIPLDKIAVSVTAGDLSIAIMERTTLLAANKLQGDTITALDAELVRAGRLIDAMAEYVGKMALPAERLNDLNDFWLFMERRKRATA